MRQRLTVAFTMYSVVWMLTACASLSPSTPVPVAGGLDAQETARMIRSRTTGLRTLTAVLGVAFSNGTRQGTFDMVVNYDASGKMRYTAFKDLLLGTRPIFDLLLADETYRLERHDDAAGDVRTGRVAHFSRDHPTFRAFWVVGEAFFLPGFDGHGNLPVVTATQPLQFTTQLKSGALARWVVTPETLDIIHAQIEDSRHPEAAALAVAYGDYRTLGTYHIPWRVTLTDPAAGFVTRSVVKQMDLNVPLPPGVFDHASSRVQPPPIHGVKAFLIRPGWSAWMSR